MIDITTGLIGMPGWQVRVGPETTRSEFMDSALGRASEINVCNEPWCSWRLPAAPWEGKTWRATIFFHGQKLVRVDAAAGAREFGESWDDWSLDKEMLRKAFHEGILARDLGPPPHMFKWGSVKSAYDSIGGGSLVIVEYAARKER